MPKDPWYKFWPDKWENDVELQSCSLGAQGLLIKFMNIMHRSDKPGYLLINGEKPDKTSLKRIINCHQNEYKTKLKELLKKGVLVEEDGVLVCPKVVRDQALRAVYRECGKRGGNPALVKGRVKAPLKHRDKKGEIEKEIKIEGTIVPSSSRALACPVDDIVELYHSSLQTLPRIRTKGKKFKARLGARWREYPSIDWWKEYFLFVAESTFLTGKKTDWSANLYWLTGPENMEKVLNNTYHRDQGGMTRYTAQNLEALRNWKEKE